MVGIAKLKKRLDNIFSKFIRLRDSDENGYCLCVTCDRTLHWKCMHAGHFISRRVLSVRFDERNVHAQCPKCNLYGAGEQYKHSVQVVKRHGLGIDHELSSSPKEGAKITKSEYEEMIKHYKLMAKDLAKQKGQQL